MCKVSSFLEEKLISLAKEKKILSPISVELKKQDVELMYASSLEIISLMYSREYQNSLESMYEHDNVELKHNLVPMWMIGFDFHITPSGPRLIEVNSNAGGLVTSALWAHSGNPQFLEKKLDRFVDTLRDEYRAWSGGSDLTSIQIVDHDPKSQFTRYDMELCKSLFDCYGIDVCIADIADVDESYDVIYNRSCDFDFSTSECDKIKNIFLHGKAFVFPNPTIYCLISNKKTLVALYRYIRNNPGSFPSIERVVLESLLISDFRSLEFSRKGWFFKPVNEYAGKGVFRGAKLSSVKFNEIVNEDYIVQAEARPGIVNFFDQEYKYDVRIFATRNEVLDLSVRAYKGRLTNFRSEHGGYARYSII